MPAEAPAYDPASGFCLPVAIAVLLLGADLRQILRRASQFLLPFALCVVGTVAGAALAHSAMGRFVDGSAQLGGVLTAGYVGGTVNFISVREQLGMSPARATAALVADNVVMAVSIAILFALAGSPRFARWLGHRPLVAGPAPGAERNPFEEPVGTWPVVLGLAVAGAVAAAGNWLGARLAELDAGIPDPSVRETVAAVIGNKYVAISVLAVALASAVPRARLWSAPAAPLGVFMLYVYLFVLGLAADLRAVARDALVLLPYCGIVAGGNLVTAVLGARLFRLAPEPVLLSINATIGGPSTAGAMAGARGWYALVLPAILTGLLGYAVATPLGVLVGRWLGTW
jgi:uncharacterized membrane protein